MLSSVRQHPILAFPGILSIALLLMTSGCGGSSAFDPASFKSQPASSQRASRTSILKGPVKQRIQSNVKRPVMNSRQSPMHWLAKKYDGR